MATVRDQINRALRLLGVLAENESPSAATENDALVAFNQMVESWSIERLAVFCTQTQSIVWPANQAKQTLGPTGDLVGNRPVSLDDSTYYVAPNNISIVPLIIDQDQYNSIGVKSCSTTMPQYIYPENTFPNMTLSVFPVPTQDLTWYFVSVLPLTTSSSLDTELSFPLGYLRAFTYNLAMEIAPEFGVEPSRQVQRIAMTSKRNLKRINSPDEYMSMPSSMVTGRQRYNVYTGL